MTGGLAAIGSAAVAAVSVNGVCLLAVRFRGVVRWLGPAKVPAPAR